MNIVGILIQIIVSVIIVAPVLWIAGRVLAGKGKAKFTDAIWIVVLGVVLGSIVGAFLSGWVAALITLIIWLALIKHFFDCGWLKALVIAIVAALIFAVIIVVLALIGIGVAGLL
ncbi:MAG: hypothetical protein QXO47_01305 [Thermoproteota archaeon]|nr:hypothetical protein [Candidatus Brockarchaeota archaeon]